MANKTIPAIQTNEGNVGIGITNPSSLLHISGAAPIIKMQGSSAATSTKVDLIGTFTTWSLENQYVNGANNDMFRIYNSALSADAITINRATNNVGIGSTNPTYKLDLSLGTISTNPNSFGYNVSGDATSNVGFCGYNFQLNNSTANASAYIRLARTSATVYLGLEIASQSRDGIRFLTNSTTPVEVVRIDNLGDVGIGTNNPGSLINSNAIYFRPNPSAKFLDLYSDTNEADINLISNNSGDGSGIGGIYFTRARAQTDAHLQVAAIKAIQVGTGGTIAGGKLYFYTKVNAAGTAEALPQMVINADGNVGIGITNAAAKLHVSGAAATFMRLDSDTLTSVAQFQAKANTDGVLIAGMYGPNPVAGTIFGANTSGAAFLGTTTLATVHPTLLAIGTSNTIPIIFGTNGIERMRLDSVGGVSIGTSSQLNSSRVSIADSALKTSAGNCLTFGTATAGSNDFQLIITRSSNTDGYYAFQSVEQGVGYKNILFNQNGGNVGIGTTNPTHKLEVFNTANSQTYVRINNQNSGTSAYAGVDLQAYGGGWQVRVPASTTFANPLIFSFNESEKARITYDGKVGIGTTNPLAVLSVGYGSLNDVNVPIQISSSGPTSERWIGANRNSGYGLLLGYYEGAGLGGSGAYIRQVTSDPLYFAVNNTTVAMSILSNTNIGIGTTNPSQKLDVNGAIIAGINNSYGAYTRTPGGVLKPWFATASANTFFYNTNVSGSIFWQNAADSATLMILTDQARLGINTNDPSGRLHVLDTVLYPPSLTWNAPAATIIRSENGQIAIGSDSSSPYSIWMQVRTASSTARPMSLNPLGGNVGIGATNPGTKLDIGSTQGGAIQLRYDTSTSYLAQITPYWNSNTDTRIDFAINRIANTTPAVIMSVGYASRVGIGTIAPVSLLDVGGPGSTTAASGLTFGGDAQANLYRAAEDTIKTDGSLNVAGLIYNGNNAYYSSVSKSTTANWGQYTVVLGNASYSSQLVQVSINGGNLVWAGTFLASCHLSYRPNETWINVKLLECATYNCSNDDVTLLALSNSTTSQYGIPALVLKTNGAINGGYGTGYANNIAVTVNGPSPNEFVLSSSSWTQPYTYQIATSANTKQIYTNEAGNVGVGTTGPVVKLEVAGALRVTGIGQIGPVGGYGIALFNAGTNTFAGQLYGRANGIQFTDNIGGNTVYIASGGNVGIGLTNPSYRLEIAAGTSNAVVAKLTQGNERVRYNGFDLLGYNDGNLWMMGNNATSTILISKDWDWDTQIGIAYTPGTVGVAGGALEIGQLTKNNASFTHGNTRFYTSGVERLRINNIGYVGINTTTPTARLQIVQSNAAGVAAILLSQDESTIQGPSANTQIRMGSNLVLNGSNITTLGTNNATRITIDVSGNVGIGTVSPYSRLDLQLASAATRYLTLSTNDSQGSYNAFGLNFRIADQGHDIAQIRGSYENSNGGGYGGLLIATRFAGTLYNRLAINDNGRVGIGVSYGTTLLTVGGAGSTTAASGITFGGDASANLYRDSSASIRTDGGFLAAGRIRSLDYIQFNSNLYSNAFTNPIDINVGNVAGNAWLSAIRFNQGGYVGMGTTQPSGKLHVVSSVSNETVLRADGTNGILFSVVDDLSDSLMSVNNSAGLPVLEVFADDRVVAGQYGSGDFVLINNKVGLGTSSPANKLTVIGAASIGSSTYNTSAPSNGLIVEGNVGIGTTNPVSKLHVKSSVGQDGIMIDAVTYSEVAFKLNGGTAKSYLSLSSVAGGYIIGSSANSLIIRNDSDIFMSADAGATSAITIKNGGNIGIGITNPSTKLSVGAASSTTAANGITFGGDAEANIYRSSDDNLTTDGNFNAAGNVNSKNSRTTTYGSITGGASGDWFPLFAVNDATDAVVMCNIRTYAHSSASFIVAKGYGASQTHAITILSAQMNPNGGYANIVGIRIREGGWVEIQLSWSSGPAVNIGVQIIGTNSTPTFAATLAPTAASDTVVDSIDVLFQGMVRTKIAFGAGNNILLNQGGTSYINGGNVGIGITNPPYKLQVSGGDMSIASANILRFGAVSVLNTASNANDIYANIRVIRNESTVNADGMFIGYNNGGTTAGHLRFYANGATERMRIQANDGHVGIGTATAAGRLDVYDDTNAGHISFVRNLNTGSSAYTAIVLRRNGGNNGLVMFTNSSNRTTDGGAGNSTIRTDNGKLLVGAGATTYHSFETNGDVGIGLTNPVAARLHIKGDGSNPVLRVETALLVAGTTTASKTFVGWMPMQTGALSPGDTVFIPLFK
jgi:hypothetical protein